MGEGKLPKNNVMQFGMLFGITLLSVRVFGDEIVPLGPVKGVIVRIFSKVSHSKNLKIISLHTISTDLVFQGLKKYRSSDTITLHQTSFHLNALQEEIKTVR
jgi:hypothetical protein